MTTPTVYNLGFTGLHKRFRGCQVLTTVDKGLSTKISVVCINNICILAKAKQERKNFF